jgi:hypothetical protein
MIFYNCFIYIKLTSFVVTRYPYLISSASVQSLTTLSYSFSLRYTAALVKKNYCYLVKEIIITYSVSDPGPGSGIRCLFDPWIRDPGWVKN